MNVRRVRTCKASSPRPPPGSSRSRSRPRSPNSGSNSRSVRGPWRGSPKRPVANSWPNATRSSTTSRIIAGMRTARSAACVGGGVRRRRPRAIARRRPGSGRSWRAVGRGQDRAIADDDEPDARGRSVSRTAAVLPAADSARAGFIRGFMRFCRLDRATRRDRTTHAVAADAADPHVCRDDGTAGGLPLDGAGGSQTPALLHSEETRLRGRRLVGELDAAAAALSGLRANSGLRACGGVPARGRQGDRLAGARNGMDGGVVAGPRRRCDRRTAGGPGHTRHRRRDARRPARVARPATGLDLPVQRVRQAGLPALPA